MNMTTRITHALALLSTIPTMSYGAQLTLSGVIDGPLSGGVPKAIEIYVVEDIADLSVCGVGSANNGSGATIQELTFDAVSATAGSFIYVASESDGFTSFFGFAPDYTGSAANINGDDAIELFCNGEMIDVFGDINTDGSGTAWEYTDGWAYRLSDTNADGSEFVLSNWYFSGTDTLDDETSNASAANPFPTASFLYGDAADGSTDEGDSDPDDGSNDGEDDSDSPVVTNDLLFSEYVEGSGSNKALELYNGTENAIDLAANNYTIIRYANGNTSGATITLTGSIASGGTFVLVNPSAEEALLAYADMTSGTVSHNGDDAYELYKDGALVDSFGRVGEDPGSAWGSGDTTTVNNTLRRLASVTTGDVNSTDEFDPANEWQGFGNDVFDDLGKVGGSTPEEPVFEVGSCSDTATLIHDIQGSADLSPVVGESHAIEGVVTASFDSLSGFFVQEESADFDQNDGTSEGIFIYYTGEQTLPAAGDKVRTGGAVSEYYDRTQITADAYVTCGSDSYIVTPVVLPFSDENSKEALEGMAISFADALTVSDNYTLGQYGEVTLSSQRLFTPTNLYTPGSAEAIALESSNALDRIVLDDVMSGSYPDPVIYPTGNLSAYNTLRLGDTVTQLTGIMDFSFSEYRLLPTVSPTFIQSNPRTTAPEIAPGNVKIASLNVLNLFNGDGEGNGFPTSRGADTLEEFERQIAKTVAAIIALDADVIGLMEIENDGFESTSTIVQLVDRLNQEVGEDRYAYVDAGAEIGTDAIAVGILYQPHRVKLEGDVLINTDDIFNRPPLAQTFRLHNHPVHGGVFTVIANHFKSKGCGSASGDDTDQGDGQGCYNAKRVSQAQTLINWIATDATLSEQDNVMVLGDLNAYAKEDPITTFEASGYTNLIADKNGTQAYSYLFGGRVGYLDHMLVSEGLLAAAVDATDWHINADEPTVLDYNVERKSDLQIADFYSAYPYRMSDHDPVVATFMLEKDKPGKGPKDKHKEKWKKKVKRFFKAVHQFFSFFFG